MQRHDEILREAVDAAGGVVFKQVGDGVCAAFPTAAGGVEAAVGARQRLRAETWPLPEPAAGPDGAAHRRRDPDRATITSGPAVNRAARVMGAGQRRPDRLLGRHRGPLPGAALPRRRACTCSPAWALSGCSSWRLQVAAATLGRCDPR